MADAKPADKQRDIYEQHADRYDALVNAEDVAGNLAPALAALTPLDGASVAEIGAGTGRITRQLVAAGAHVAAFDRARPMLDVAGAHLRAAASDAWALGVADARALPVADRCADLAVAGWVFGHFRLWLPDDWRTAIGQAVDELERVLRPGGVAVVIETLGTAKTEPGAPSPHLAEYYAWLEGERGYLRTVIETDYGFATVDEAADVLGFFFGDDFATRVRAERWTRVPEFTGVWSRTPCRDRAVTRGVISGKRPSPRRA